MRVRCVFRDSVLIRPWIPEDEDEEDDEGDEEGWYEVEEVEVVEGSEKFMHAQLDMDVPIAADADAQVLKMVAWRLRS